MITVVSFAFVSDESGVNLKIHLMSLSEMQLLLWGSYGTDCLLSKAKRLLFGLFREGSCLFFLPCER